MTPKLFDDDGPGIPPENPGPAEDVAGESRDGVYRLSLNLRRCGVAKLPSPSCLAALLEVLTAKPLRAIRLDESLEVDGYLWNFVVLQLLQADYNGDITRELKEWPFYRDKAKFLASAGAPIQEVYIYNAMRDIPTIVYCRNKKKFLRESVPSSTSHVAEIRYELVLEVSRRATTWSIIQEQKSRSEFMRIATVDAVSHVSKGEQTVIGTIGIDKKGGISLKGTLSELQLCISDDTVIKSGVYCAGSTVIVEGIMEPYKESLRCISISHPPLAAKMDLPDFFGGNVTRQEQSALELRMAHQVECGGTEQWVIISDIHFDNDATLEAFETLLDTFLAMYQQQGFPAGFVLMGNFTSTAFNLTGNTPEKYGQAFERLYRLLVKPKFRVLLTTSYFVLLPGPGDATPCPSLLPMPPLLGEFTLNLRDRMETFLGAHSKFVCGTNPCRIRHLTRRMLFCRNDLFNKLLCTSILTSGGMRKTTPPSELKTMLVTTVLGQGHLCPNKPGGCTILKHDAALLLYPAPDLVCIGDVTCPSFVETLGSTVFCNLESFSSSRSFVSYDVVSGKCQKFIL